MVGQLADKKYDFLAADLSITYERSLVIDFSLAVALQESKVVIQRPGQGSEWKSYLIVFPTDFWLVTGLVLTSFVVLHRLLFGGSLAESVGTILCTIINRELSFAPVGAGRQMFVLTVLLTCCLIFSFYCAFLVSFLAVKRVNWPFKDLEGLLDSNYKLVHNSWQTKYHVLCSL